MTLELHLNINYFAFIKTTKRFSPNTGVETKKNCDRSIESKDKIKFDHTMRINIVIYTIMLLLCTSNVSRTRLTSISFVRYSNIIYLK